MGTSLSGLTPATTFDGLLKVGDNDPLTATLKPISTGDGTDTMLELSTSALQIGGATGMYWDNTNKRLGLNDVTPTSKIDIKNTFGASALSQLDRMGLFVGYTSASFGIALGGTSSYTSGLVQGTNNIGNASGTLSLNPFGSDVGVGSVSPTAKLHIKGSGATSATTSLLVQNSAGTDLLKVEDGGNIGITGFTFQSNIIKPNINGFIGIDHNSNRNFAVIDSNGARTYLKVQSSSTSSFADVSINTDHLVVKKEGNVAVGTATIPASTRMTIKGAGNTDATTSLLVQNSDGNTLLKVVDDGEVRIGETTGSLTAEGNNVFLRGTNIYFRERLGGYLGNFREEGFQIGNGSAAATARLQVKGSGATSATTSLLVQNSAGTEHLKITDDGTINTRQSIIVNHATNSSRSLKLGWGSIYATDNNSELAIGAVLTQAATAPRIILGGKTRASGADAVLVQALNGMYLSTTASTENPSAQLHVKGSGATSATTSLLVENSAGSESLTFSDDGVLTTTGNIVFNGFIGNSNGTYSITPNASTIFQIKSWQKPWNFVKDIGTVMTLDNDGNLGLGNSTDTNTARLHVKAGTTQDSIAKFEDPRATTDYIEIKNDSTLTDYTGLYWGTRAKIRSKQAGAMFLDCAFGISFADGNTAKSKIDANGNMSVGVATIPASTRMTIKGQGATSATTALLVENSSGTDTLEVRDDGRVVAGTGATTNANGTFNVLHGTSNLTTRVFTVSRDSVLRGMDINSGGSTKISDSSGDQSFSHTATAVFEVSSTTQGFLPPRMTGTQRDAIESPASGLIIYNTTTNKAQCYNGTSWNDMF